MTRALVAMTLILLAVPALAQDAAPMQLDTRVQTVALFKNGLGFFIRGGELPQPPAQVEIGPLPAAAHGTFWIGWGEGVQFANLRSREVSAPQTRDPLTIAEMIRANVGQQARLWLAPEEEIVTGRILMAPETPTRVTPNPYISITPPPTPPDAANLVVVQTDAATVALPIGRISRIEFPQTPAMQVPVDAKHVALTGNLVGGQAGAPVSLSYLAMGMTWAPSYLVDITNDEEALMTAKAVIINEIEDLEATRVELVTGFPYLEYSHVVSPLAQRQDLAAFLNALRRGVSDRTREAAVMMQRAGPAGPAGPADAVMPDYGAAAEAVAVEDLFFYPLENVTLARGETGYFPLFSQRVPYEHVYTWQVADRVDASARYRAVPDEVEQIVWHSLRLENETAMPWTTAPAQTVSQGRILGQSTLDYTPRGAETLLRITRAMEIVAEEIETEARREPNAATFHGTRYDRVTVNGTLSMRSHLDRDVTVEVTKLLTGEVLQASPEAEIVRLAYRIQGVNPRSRLIWELPLAAGETVEMTYTYSAYVRN